MKHTKKMILVPETEYHALLGMLKPQDALSFEKAKVESEMATTLRKPKMNADLRMKKYDWLLKQRRNLKEKIEDIPQKVQIENLEELYGAPSIPPYLDVGTPSTRLGSTQSPGTERTEQQASTSATETPPSRRQKRVKHVILEEDVPLLKTYLSRNKKKFEIGADDRILSHGTNRSIAGTNYLDMVNYLAKRGKARGMAPRGIEMLVSKLANDPFYHTLLAKAQEGRGKINPIKKIQKVNKLIKATKRTRVFKPVMWAKL